MFVSTPVRSTPKTFGYSNLWSRSRRDLDHRFWGTGKGMTCMSWLMLPLFHTGQMYYYLSNRVKVWLRWPGWGCNTSIACKIGFQTCRWLTQHSNFVWSFDQVPSTQTNGQGPILFEERIPSGRRGILELMAFRSSHYQFENDPL